MTEVKNLDLRGLGMTNPVPGRNRTSLHRKEGQAGVPVRRGGGDARRSARRPGAETGAAGGAGRGRVPSEPVSRHDGLSLRGDAVPPAAAWCACAMAERSRSTRCAAITIATGQRPETRGDFGVRSGVARMQPQGLRRSNMPKACGCTGDNLCDSREDETRRASHSAEVGRKSPTPQRGSPATTVEDLNGHRRTRRTGGRKSPRGHSGTPSATGLPSGGLADAARIVGLRLTGWRGWSRRAHRI
jgi:hypothetical protein